VALSTTSLTEALGALDVAGAGVARVPGAGDEMATMCPSYRRLGQPGCENVTESIL
jgi:hypothetical protein